VCISVQVDEAVLPNLSDSSLFGFTSAMVEHMKLLDTISRGQGRVPGTSQYFVNKGGPSLRCAGASDIYVNVRYLPRGDGGRFRAELEIRQGEMALTRSTERMVEAEIRYGKLARSQTPYSDALLEDVLLRAEVIHGMIR
jgi:hypothetical protein